MREKLDAILLQSGVLTEKQLAAAKADAARTKKRLPETIIDLGLLTEQQFARLIAGASGVPIVDPILEDKVGALAHRISRGIARQFEVVPVRIDGEEMYVALTNPLDASAIDVLNATTGFRIRPLTGLRSSVERLVQRFYPEDYDAPDITVLPNQMFEEPGLRQQAPQSGAGASEPFDISNETLIGSLKNFRFAPSDEISPAEPAITQHSQARTLGDISTQPTNPFIALDRRLDQLTKMVSRVEKRLEAIETALAQAPRH